MGLCILDGGCRLLGGNQTIFRYTTCMIGMCISLYQVLPCTLTLIIWLPVCVSGKKAPDVMSIQHEPHTHFLLQSGYYYQVLQSKKCAHNMILSVTLFPPSAECYQETNSTLFACLLLHMQYTTHRHTLTLKCTYPHTSSHIHSRWSLTSLAVRILMPALTQMKDVASGARLVLHFAPSSCEHTLKTLHTEPYHIIPTILC